MPLAWLDDRRAAAMEALCEVIVPGSARVGPVLYIDAVLGRMPAPDREAALAAIDQLEEAATEGAEALAEHAFTPEFIMVRALAVEAYYSDFLAPGRSGPSAWQEIDFNTPLATRLDKDWSYLGIEA
jgi:long-chain-alcohol oxidase